jgi:hypothetical protein
MNNCAFERGCECSALNVKACEGCSFFKTKEELSASREKARERVNSFPPKKRSKIFNKYFSKPVTRMLREAD